MSKALDVPVTNSSGEVIGRAEIEVDEGGIIAHITFDRTHTDVVQDLVGGTTQYLVVAPVVRRHSIPEPRVSVRPKFMGPVPQGVTLTNAVSKHPHIADFDLERNNRTLGQGEIEHRFGFHKGTIEGPNATAPRHAYLRNEFKDFADMLDRVLPPGRAKSVAFTELETAAMWTHKSIAELAPVEEG